MRSREDEGCKPRRNPAVTPALARSRQWPCRAMRGLSLLLLAALVAGATADGSYFFFFGPGINWPPINRPPGLGGASGATTVTPVGPPRV